MAILVKRGGVLVDLPAQLYKRDGKLVTPADVLVKKGGALVSALAPAVRRGAQIVGAPIAGTPMLVERAVFWGIGLTAQLNTYVNGVLVKSGGLYTPLEADIGKAFYVDDVATNAWGVAHAISGSRVCVAALSVPVLLDSYDGPTSNYTFAANSTTSIDSTGHVQGAGRVRVAGTGNGTNTTLTVTRTLANINPAALDVLAYCGSKTAASVTTGTGLNLARSAANNTVSQSDGATKFRSGNHWLASNISEYPAVKDLPVGNLTVKQSIQQVSPYTSPADGAVDALYSNAGGRPTVVLTIDDFTASAWLELYPLLKARDFPATFFLPPGQLGLPNKGTWWQARMMEAGGMDMGLNTLFDVAATTFASPALYAADLVAGRVLARLNGISERCLFAMALSNGAWTEAHLAALQSIGMRMARTTEPQCIHTRFGFGDQAMTMPSFSITGSVTLAAAIAQVELAKTRKATQFFHTHDVSDNPTNIGWAKTLKMIPWLDYCVAERDAGRIDLLTVSQLDLRDGAATAPA